MAMEYIVLSIRIFTVMDMADNDIMEERLEKLLVLEEDHFIAGFHQQVQKTGKRPDTTDILSIQLSRMETWFCCMIISSQSFRENSKCIG